MFGNFCNFLFTSTTLETTSTSITSLAIFNDVMTPLFCVWVLSIFVWFGLELAVLNAHFFNTKHSYVSQIKRQFISLIIFSSLFFNTKKISLLNQFFTKNL